MPEKCLSFLQSLSLSLEIVSWWWVFLEKSSSVYRRVSREGDCSTTTVLQVDTRWSGMQEEDGKSFCETGWRSSTKKHEETRRNRWSFSCCFVFLSVSVIHFCWTDQVLISRLQLTVFLCSFNANASHGITCCFGMSLLHFSVNVPSHCAHLIMFCWPDVQDDV